MSDENGEFVLKYMLEQVHDYYSSFENACDVILNWAIAIHGSPFKTQDEESKFLGEIALMLVKAKLRHTDSSKRRYT